MRAQHAASSGSAPAWPPATPAELAWFLTPPGETVLPPTQAQSEVIESTEGSLLVVAGAGSGKTRTMAEKVAWIVSQGLARPDEILGVTFTKKAAAELGHRIRGNLQRLEAARALYEPARQRARQAAEQSGDALSGASAEPELSLDDIDVEVSTYHSYAKRLVSDYGLRLGIEPNAPMLGDAQAFILARSVVENSGADDSAEESDPVSDPGLESLYELPMSSIVRSVLRLAGERAEHGVTWDEIRENLDLYIASAEKAIAAKKLAGAEKLLSTLRQRRALVHLAETYTQRKRELGLLDFGDLIELAVKLARDFPDVGESERRRFSYVLLDEFQDTSHNQMELFAELFGPRLLPEDSPESPGQGAEPASGSTSGERTPQGAGVRVVGARGITAVGDPNQSIYGFRGASAGQLSAFLGRFSVPRQAAGQANLSQAWRNPLGVLEIANEVAAPLSIRPDFVRAVSVDVPKLVPGVDPAPGRILFGEFAFADLDVPEALAKIAALEDVKDPDAVADFTAALRGFSEPRSETTAIADFIEYCRRPAADPSNQTAADAPTVAVLSRTRAALEPIFRKLEDRGIPCEITGLGALLNEPEIVELVAYLRAMTDTSRSDAIVRILSSPKFLIGPADLAALGDWARHNARVARMQSIGSVSSALRPEDVSAETAADAAAAHSTVQHGTVQHSTVQHSAAAAEPPEATGDLRRQREIQDLAEAASLVTALDDLPRSSSWTSIHGRSFTEDGLSRLREAGALLAALRRLPMDDVVELIQDVERAIGLDVELAALPGRSSHTARRHIDAFLDEASDFSAGSSYVTVSAFLDWLDAAAEHENGLKPVETEVRQDVVQLMTVHASKGLEWDVVVVPKLESGVFPGERSSRWTLPSGAMMPYGLRGDADNLPQWLPDTDSGRALVDSHEAFSKECRDSEEREERRLAYVAFTRARHTLWCSRSAYSEGRVGLHEASPYWADARKAAERSALAYGTDVIEIGGSFSPVTGGKPASNPLSSVDRRAIWPVDPLGERRAGFEAAAAAVVESRQALGHGVAEELESEQGRLWAEETELLIERERTLVRQRQEALETLRLPEKISVSSFVQIVDSELRTAEQLSRPVPRKPSRAARRGTTFHSFLEEHFQRQAGFDLEEGWDDEGSDLDTDLEELIERFRASEWANRQAHGVEVLIETKIAGQRVKGRVDAIFQNADGSWDLVDWKTGRIPQGDDLRVKSLQLALYRVGWSQVTGTPVESIGACFYYVDSNTTVRPVPLPGIDELEEMFRSKVALEEGQAEPTGV